MHKLYFNSLLQTLIHLLYFYAGQNDEQEVEDIRVADTDLGGKTTI